MTSPRFDPGSTSVRPRKPWTSPFYSSINGPSFKTLLSKLEPLHFFIIIIFFLGAVLGSLCLRRKFGLWRLEFHLLIYIDWTLNSKISLDTSTLLIFFISLISLEFWYMEWNLAWTQWDGKTLRTVLALEQQFSVFKQHYTYFYTLFHLHVFSKNINNVTRTTLPNTLIVWTLNSKISPDTSTLLIFFISLISLEFWYMEWNLA